MSLISVPVYEAVRAADDSLELVCACYLIKDDVIFGYVGKNFYKTKKDADQDIKKINHARLTTLVMNALGSQKKVLNNKGVRKNVKSGASKKKP